MYVNILDDYMNVLTRSEMSNIMQKRRKQDEVSSCCHCATLCGRGSPQIQVGGGGETTVYVFGFCLTCILTRVV